MRPVRSLLMLSMLACGLAGGHAQAADWVSYRDAYRVMVVFDKYGGPKNLLQQQLQVLPRDGQAEGQELTLTGKTTSLRLPLDPLGRAVFPLLKAAYDDNAVLQLGRGAGFTVRPRVSLVLRADGVYESAELRAACEQALGYARYLGGAQRQCVGVRFVFDRRAAPAVRLRKADGGQGLLAAEAGPAFSGEAGGSFATVSYRFAGAERVQLLTATAPLVITPLFE